MAYQDTFSTPEPTSFWTWVAGEVAGDASQSGGVMRLKTTDFYSWYSAGGLDLVGMTVSVELVTSPTAEDTETYIFVYGNDTGEGPYIVVWVLDGVTTIKAQAADGTNWQATYDPATHSHLRVRELDGTAYLATSGDGGTWTERVSSALEGDFTVATLDISAGRTGGAATPTFVEWDNFSLVSSTPATGYTSGLGGLINRPCTLVLRAASGVEDAYGNETSGEERVETVCEVQQRRRDEPDASGELSRADWDGYFPAGTSLNTASAIEVDGLGVFELVGAPWPVRSPWGQAESHVEATLNLTAAAEDA